MNKKAAAPNPFYALLVVVGVVFSLTACAYGMMAVRGVKAGGAAGEVPESESAAGMLHFLDQHGAKLLGAEIIALALATVGAMASDSWWSWRAAAAGDAVVDPTSGNG